jgi:hypothetical protein
VKRAISPIQEQEMDPGWKKAYVSQGPIQTATVDHDSVVAG